MKVITGKDKGRSGVVVRAFPRENKVVIDGVALFKRHTKGRAGQVGRTVEKPRPIDASNVALVSTTKGTSALETTAKKAKPVKASK